MAGGLGLVASVAAATREQGGHQLLLCSSFDTVDLALLEAAGPRLEAVVTVSAGYNHVDTALLARRGLVLATTPGVLEDSCTVLYYAVLYPGAGGQRGRGRGRPRAGLCARCPAAGQPRVPGSVAGLH